MKKTYKFISNFFGENICTYKPYENLHNSHENKFERMVFSCKLFVAKTEWNYKKNFSYKNLRSFFQGSMPRWKDL